MLKFINKSDYNLPTYKQVSPEKIKWDYVDGNGVAHSGFFIKSRKSSHLREDEEFEPFAEVLELGLAPEFNQSAYYAEVQAKQKEEQRLVLKSTRESDLKSIVHDFGDGRIVQVRPQDIANFQIAISTGQDQQWIMQDNSVASITVAELQTALDSGISQNEQIYNDYISALKSLNH